MRRLCAFRRKRLVVILLGRIGIERQVELVAPAEFKTGLAERIVANLGGRVALGKVGGMGSELVGDDADLHIIAVGQTEMLLGRDIAKHRRAIPAEPRGPDAARDRIIAWRAISATLPNQATRSAEMRVGKAWVSKC